MARREGAVLLVTCAAEVTLAKGPSAWLAPPEQIGGQILCLRERMVSIAPTQVCPKGSGSHLPNGLDRPGRRLTG